MSALVLLQELSTKVDALTRIGERQVPLPDVQVSSARPPLASSAAATHVAMHPHARTLLESYLTRALAGVAHFSTVRLEQV